MSCAEPSCSYIGEVGIWTGIWALSTVSLQTVHFPAGTVAFAAISPLFTYYLLRYVSFSQMFICATPHNMTFADLKLSGVPPLERSGQKKFGNDPKWQEYKR